MTILLLGEKKTENKLQALQIFGQSPPFLHPIAANFDRSVMGAVYFPETNKPPHLKV